VNTWSKNFAEKSAKKGNFVDQMKLCKMSKPIHYGFFVNFILLILYEIALWIIALLAIPKTIYSFFVYKKYRQSLLPRLGIGYPVFQKSSHPSIWIHGVSVGETKAVVAVARELKRMFPENPLIISTVTETGYAEGKRSLPFADYHVYLPFDFTWVVSKIIKNASPGLVLLCESDFWYNFLYYSKKQGAALGLVNGKMSDCSMRRFRLFPFFSKPLFGLFDVLCLQNNHYRDRFIEAGASPEKIVVTGNLKLDEDYPQLSNEETIEWRQKLGIQPNQLVLTIGSTHAPEEQIFIQILNQIWKSKPELRVILVPRRPELFKEVGHLLEKERVNWISFTDINRRTGKEQVILMDAMGLLRMCYQLSDFAVVGGSFTDRVGGHNILEPCWYGKPVLFGPHMYTQLELVDLMTQYGAGIQVVEDQLQTVLARWIEQPKEAQEIGAQGIRLVKDLKGSTGRTLQVLDPLLAKLR
jgi:3-deoxy-D-manno-octulosonic-acid transferase